MTRPVRSVRLLKRSANSLDVLSGSPGEIFFDESNGTLRVYTGTAGEKIIIATRSWVEDNSSDGNYNTLTNKPPLSVVSATGLYTDLLNVAAADTLVYTPTTPADWDGTAPTTVLEALDRLATVVKSLNGDTGA
tara:strand:+ start:772 stop:1173 length:402 start_codon:yes stop_codon:yes gene_type:complete